MLEILSKLLIIQDRDVKIRNLEKELAKIPMEKELIAARLQKDQGTLAGATKTVQENEIAMKNLELDIETRRDTIGKLKTQQFETRKNEEYASLGKDIVRYADEIEKLEDQQLELMEKGEELKAVQSEAQAKLRQSEGLVEIELKALDERSVNDQKEIGEHREFRDRVAPAIDGTTLSIYERLLKGKGDRAIVPLNGESCMCGGCHMKLMKATLLGVMAGKEVVKCENCGRMLYLEE